MVLVEGLIINKMGITPTSIALMMVYNLAWAAGAIFIGENIFGSPDTDLTYIGEGLYKDSQGNLWQEY